MKKIFQVVLIVIVLVLLVDLGGFLLWVGSGQTPPDQFYVGSITAHVITFTEKHV